MPVHYELRAASALLSLDQPPVNGLGLALRTELAQALQRAEADPAVQTIVLTGRGSCFSGGADIREFGSAQATQSPNLHELIEQVERSRKPVVVAIAGTTLGGGLELALAAHHRIANADALVGLPEVRIGLLPGAGGTQRLPRAAGLETALAMIVSGTPRAAAALADSGLFDRVVDGDAVEAALAFAADLDGSRTPKVRDRPVAAADATAALASARSRTPAHDVAALACIDAVEAAVQLPFDEGLAFEREGFTRLLDAPQSKALRHAFFAERAASRIAGLDASTPARPLRHCAVIGAGTMGGGITMSLLDAGVPVTLIEAGQETLDRGVAGIRKLYENSVRKGRLDAERMQQRLALLQPSLDYADLADADLVIEAVYEEFSVKAEVFRRIDAAARPGAVLATNTSTLDVDRIAACTARPQDVLGLHFFSPAQVMKLLEIVRGEATAPDVLATGLALARRIGKIAVVARVCDGFIGNRMVEQYFRQAGFLLDEGAQPQQIDAAMEAFGFAMGPFRMSDLAGNDIGWAIRKRRRIECPDLVYSASADRLCELGRFGQKTGKGWYDYQPGDRSAHVSAEVEALLDAHRRDSGVAQRSIDDTEIVERLVYALVNEGAALLDEGIADKASDIDVVYLHGYGFPRWRGGPMFHADSVGLDRVLTAMQRFSTGYRGEAWQPAPLLQRLAQDGSRFNDAGGTR